MPFILYYVYKDITQEGVKTPISVSIDKMPETDTKILVGAAMSDEGLRKFFADVWWGKNKKNRGVYLQALIGIDRKLVGELEDILSPKIEVRRFEGPCDKDILKRRKPRKDLYVYCVPGIVPDWVDAEYIPGEEVLKKKP